MVTIKDISKACGVSPATVSKALNGYDDISAETITATGVLAKRSRRRNKSPLHSSSSAGRGNALNMRPGMSLLFSNGTQLLRRLVREKLH